MLSIAKGTDKRTDVWSRFHVFTLKFLTLKNFFFHFLGVYFFSNFYQKVLFNFSMRTLKCYQKIKKKKSLTPKKWKNRPQTLLIIGPDPFISQSSPDQSPQPTAQNWFFILWNLGTRHLLSYLWLTVLIILRRKDIKGKKCRKSILVWCTNCHWRQKSHSFPLDIVAFEGLMDI